ncbi:MAG: hypothetical protein NC417_13910 [Candidatus Gastranaerophilales bacterium]|nr:hypothetical protein [Candidatus Gastranaerophilales bacterium]
MIAEIHHKVFSNLEDELTGNFFGIMRYIPFQRGLKQIYMRHIHSLDGSVRGLISSIRTNEFDIEFWKRSELGYGEIDGYMELDGMGIGIEVKYQSGLSGENQLEREAAMLSEWCKSGEKILILVAGESDAKEIYRRNYLKGCFADVHLAYITWQDILLGLDEIKIVNGFEDLMVGDLKGFLKEKGFMSFGGFSDKGLVIDGGAFYDFG